MSSHSNYHSYLLRFWRDNAEHPWRASLQSTMTEERLFFTDPTCLIDFLLTTLTPADPNGETADETLPSAPPDQR